MLSPGQLPVLKADILADATLAAHAIAGNIGRIVEAYSVIVAPDFWVWRTAVTRSEIYHRTSPNASQWNWTTYKQQSVAEQNAWVQMFMGDEADFSLPNLRSGVAAIFTGNAAQLAQQAHVLAHGRRLANRGEKLFVAPVNIPIGDGDGTTTNPAHMTFEGAIRDVDIENALKS